MDFDEYEYLEKTVENPEQQNATDRDEALKSEKIVQDRSLKHRNDGDSDLVHHSKHSKSEDDSHGRNRHRERGSSRHRSRSRDREKVDKDRDRHRSSRDRDRERERAERNGKGRHCEKDKDRDMAHERDRERQECYPDRERDGDRDRHRDRRSRIHLERHREDKEKSWDKEYREKGRDGERRYARAMLRWSFGNCAWLWTQIMGLKCPPYVRGVQPNSYSLGATWEEFCVENSMWFPAEHVLSPVPLMKLNEVLELLVSFPRKLSNKEKKDVAEPVVDPERDQRTVFAYQIALKADERDVFEFFSRAGKVRDVRLIMDRNSRRSKGVGYIEFYDAMSVPMAIALSGQPVLGQPVMVKPSEAEKNMAQSTSSIVASAQASTYSGGGRRIYVGNLHYNMTEEQLRQVFEPFGTVELIQLPLDDTGHCKGFGFIQFAQLDEAQAALNLNGQLDIAGRTIKVSAVTDNIGTQDAGKNTGDLDDDEGGILHLNAQSRALLMAKLDRGGAATSVGGYLGTTLVSNGGLSSAPALGIQPVIPALIPSIPPLGGLSALGLPLPLTDIIGVPSECLLLKNMFDPNAELEPDFDLDIKEDVQDECAKFGSLKHIHVEKYSVGFVYLRFENTQSAASAQRALHGRWFAGKMITATFMLPQNYEAKFPDVKWEAAS